MAMKQHDFDNDPRRRDKAVLTGANLRNANLHRALLRGADTRGAQFVGANVSGVHLRDAQMDPGSFLQDQIGDVGI